MTTTLVIKESKWLHGNPNNSTLLDRDGCMCCLGFYAKSLEAEDSQILHRETPAACSRVQWHPKLVDEVSLGNSPFCAEIIRLNDFPETEKDKRLFLAERYYPIEDNVEVIPLPEKKQRLTALFAQMDIQLQFVQ